MISTLLFLHPLALKIQESVRCENAKWTIQQWSQTQHLPGGVHPRWINFLCTRLGDFIVNTLLLLGVTGHGDGINFSHLFRVSDDTFPGLGVDINLRDFSVHFAAMLVVKVVLFSKNRSEQSHYNFQRTKRLHWFARFQKCVINSLVAPCVIKSALSFPFPVIFKSPHHTVIWSSRFALARDV